jgi:hypothetical protein
MRVVAVLVATLLLAQACCKVTVDNPVGNTRLLRVVLRLLAVLLALRLLAGPECVLPTHKLMAPVETVETTHLVAAGVPVTLAVELEVRELPTLVLVAEVAVVPVALLPVQRVLLAAMSRHGLQPRWLHTHTL